MGNKRPGGKKDAGDLGASALPALNPQPTQPSPFGLIPGSLDQLQIAGPQLLRSSIAAGVSGIVGLDAELFQALLHRPDRQPLDVTPPHAVSRHVALRLDGTIGRPIIALSAPSSPDSTWPARRGDRRRAWPSHHQRVAPALSGL